MSSITALLKETSPGLFFILLSLMTVGSLFLSLISTCRHFYEFSRRSSWRGRISSFLLAMWIYRFPTSSVEFSNTNKLCYEAGTGFRQNFLLYHLRLVTCSLKLTQRCRCCLKMNVSFLSIWKMFVSLKQLEELDVTNVFFFFKVTVQSFWGVVTLGTDGFSPVGSTFLNINWHKRTTFF